MCFKGWKDRCGIRKKQQPRNAFRKKKKRMGRKRMRERIRWFWSPHVVFEVLFPLKWSQDYCLVVLLVSNPPFLSFWPFYLSTANVLTETQKNEVMTKSFVIFFSLLKGIFSDCFVLCFQADKLGVKSSEEHQLSISVVSVESPSPSPDMKSMEEAKAGSLHW